MSHFLNSPVFTGAPQAPTPAGSSNDTTIATTAFVKSQVSAGTLTAISIATANGFQGSSGGGATPVLTLQTSITGLLKGSGNALVAATAGDINGQLLTGFVLGADGSAVAATDSILVGFQKHQVAINARQTTANLSTSTSLGTSDTLYPSQNAVKTYVDNAVVGLLDDRGSYDASVNTFPAAGGSGSAGAILKGDLWYISVAGTLGGTTAGIGSSVRALTNAPGQTAANWDIMDAGLGFVPAQQNQTFYLGTTQIAINAGSGTVTTLAGMTSITCTTFVGALTGNATSSGYASNTTITEDTTTATAVYPTWVTANTGNLPQKTTSTKLSFIPSTGILSATGFAGSGAGLTSIPWTALPFTPATAAQTFFLGTTSLAINAGTGTQTVLAGMTSITSTTFVGALTGNASSATNASNTGITEDVATATAVYPTWVTANTGNLPQKTTSTKLSFIPSTGVLSATGFAGSGAGLTSIPNSALTNSSVTIGSTAVALGTTVTTFVGLTSVTSTTFVGALTGNATTATTATNLAGGGAGTIPYNTAAGATTQLAAGTTSQVLIGGAAPSWTNTPTLTGTNFTGIPWTALPSTGSKPRVITAAAKTGNYTITNADDIVLCDATTGAFVITLPPTPVNGENYTIKKIDSSANAVSINGNSKNIDGSASQSLPAQWNAFVVTYNGTAWFIS